MSGRHPRNTLEHTSAGNHSDTFHAPDAAPVSWPTRTEIVRSGVRSEAFLRIRSETHLDSL